MADGFLIHLNLTVKSLPLAACGTAATEAPVVHKHAPNKLTESLLRSLMITIIIRTIMILYMLLTLDDCQKT